MKVLRDPLLQTYHTHFHICLSKCDSPFNGMKFSWTPKWDEAICQQKMPRNQLHHRPPKTLNKRSLVQRKAFNVGGSRSPQKTHLQSDLKVGEQKNELLGSACKVNKNRRCCRLHLVEKQRSALINWYGFHSSMFSIWYFGGEVKSHSFPCCFFSYPS